MNLITSVFLLFYLCESIFLQKVLKCPYGWYKFNSSCYKTYSAESYSNAMDTCFKLLIKQKNIRRSHLVNIETDEEMSFVGSLMIHLNHSNYYIGANNIIKRSNVLLWERLGLNFEVEKRFFCDNLKIESTNYYCGYVKYKLDEPKFSRHFNQTYGSLTTTYYNFQYTSQPYNNSYMNTSREALLPILSYHNIHENLCINASDCFTPMPYLCEINCTYQEQRCITWSEEYNNELFKNNKTLAFEFSSLKPRTKPTTTTTKIDPCIFKLDKCKNNSTCIFDPNSIEDYYCACHPGYEGVYCQRDERPCEPVRNRCINNSTCNHYGSGKFYNCTCQPGFEGFHCELDVVDCPPGICENGGQCEDLINSYRCVCLSFFSGKHCEIKNQELVIVENVSRSFSIFAIFFIIMTYAFFISLDALRFVFKIEPEGLSEERNLIRKKKLIKKIMEDMKSKRKRRRYKKIITSNYNLKDPFVAEWEKTFGIPYSELKWIDEEQNPSEINNGP